MGNVTYREMLEETGCDTNGDGKIGRGEYQLFKKALREMLEEDEANEVTARISKRKATWFKIRALLGVASDISAIGTLVLLLGIGTLFGLGINLLG